MWCFITCSDIAPCHNTLFFRAKLTAIHDWTNSTVVFSWLTTSQAHFKIFVTNRLSKIYQLLPSCNWHCVYLIKTPSDCVSRHMLLRKRHLIIYVGKVQCFWRNLPGDCWWTFTFQNFPVDQLPEQEASSVAIHFLTIPDMDTNWLK